MSHKIRRREFLKLSALGAVGAAAAGDATITAVDRPETTRASTASTEVRARRRRDFDARLWSPGSCAAPPLVPAAGIVHGPCMCLTLSAVPRSLRYAQK